MKRPHRRLPPLLLAVILLLAAAVPVFAEDGEIPAPDRESGWARAGAVSQAGEQQAATEAATAPGEETEPGGQEPGGPENTAAGARMAARAAGDYHTGDIAVVNSIIDNNGLPWTKADPVDGDSVPGDWTGVTWSAATTNRRIIRLDIASQTLTGTLDVTGLTDLKSLICHNNQLTELDLDGLPLTNLDCGFNPLERFTAPDGKLLAIQWTGGGRVLFGDTTRGYDPASQTVNLVPVAGSGYRFTGWSGDVATGQERDNPLAFTLTGTSEVTAEFARTASPAPNPDPDPDPDPVPDPDPDPAPAPGPGDSGSPGRIGAGSAREGSPGGTARWVEIAPAAFGAAEEASASDKPRDTPASDPSDEEANRNPDTGGYPGEAPGPHTDWRVSLLCAGALALVMAAVFWRRVLAPIRGGGAR